MVATISSRALGVAGPHAGIIVCNACWQRHSGTLAVQSPSRCHWTLLQVASGQQQQQQQRRQIVIGAEGAVEM
jgi:hypothetical protein